MYFRANGLLVRCEFLTADPGCPCDRIAYGNLKPNHIGGLLMANSQGSQWSENGQFDGDKMFLRADGARAAYNSAGMLSIFGKEWAKRNQDILNKDTKKTLQGL